MNILSDLQDQVVNEIKTELSDDSGTSLVRVRRIEVDNEFIVGEQIESNERQVATWPHVYVYNGILNTNDADSTNRLLFGDVNFRVFIGTRNANSDNLEAQKKLGDKWALYVTSALAGKRFGVPPYTTEETARNFVVEPIRNFEDFALWQVSFQVPVHVGLDDILANVQNEA